MMYFRLLPSVDSKTSRTLNSVIPKATAPMQESAANADESQHFESALSETAVPDGIEDRMTEWLAEADEPNDLMENEDFVDFIKMRRKTPAFRHGDISRSPFRLH